MVSTKHLNNCNYVILNYFSAQGCFVTGLFIEGAEWSIEHNSLLKSKPNILVEALPILAIIPTEERQIQVKVRASVQLDLCESLYIGHYICIKYDNSLFAFQNNIVVPVYLTKNRAETDGLGLIFEAYLRIRDHPSKWILQGVCLILNTDRQ